MSTGNFRPLNAPRPIQVKADASGAPVAVKMRGTVRRVAQVLDVWRLDDEWWRESPISRMYYRIEYGDGGIDTIYHDLVTGDWYWQRA